MDEFIVPRLEGLDSQPEAKVLLDKIMIQKTVQTMLWTGPEGSGKKTHALALARSLFCLSGPGCQGCAVCRQVLNRTHPDFFWLVREDGKNEVTVESTRELEKKLANAPLSAPLKIAVVAEADRMNRDAQNVFLKTLEEPPAKTLVILLAERSASFLPTVLSRCRPVRFGRLGAATVESILTKTYGLEKEKARQTAESCDGNLTLALKSADPNWAEFAAKVEMDFDKALTGGDGDWLQTALQYEQMEPEFFENEEWTTAQRKAEVAKAALRVYASLWNRRLLNTAPIPAQLQTLAPEAVLQSLRKHLDIIPAYLSARMVLDHLFLELREGFQKGEINFISFMDEVARI
ncbi:MAG: AAA family ATPase [bacterium]